MSLQKKRGQYPYQVGELLWINRNFIHVSIPYSPCSEFPRSLQFLSVMNIKLFMTSRKRGFICVKHSLIWLFHISLSRHPKARKEKSMWCYPCEMIAPKTTGANIQRQLCHIKGVARYAENFTAQQDGPPLMRRPVL